MGDFLALCPDSVLKCPFFSIHGEGALFAWIGHLYGIGGLVKRYKCGFGSPIIDVRSSRRGGGGGEHMAAAGCLTAWLAAAGWPSLRSMQNVVWERRSGAECGGGGATLPTGAMPSSPSL